MRPFSFPITFLLLSFCLPMLVRGQGEIPVVEMKATGIKRDMVVPPSQGTMKGSGNAQSNNWLTVVFDYTVSSEQVDFMDELQFKIYIEATEFAGKEDKEGKPVVLTGETTYVNIPAKGGGETSSGAFVVHPNTVARFGGEKEFDKRNIHIDALVQGQVVASVDFKEEKDPRWFESLKKVAGQVISKEQSPWVMADVNRFPAAKQKTPAN